MRHSVGHSPRTRQQRLPRNIASFATLAAVFAIGWVTPSAVDNIVQPAEADAAIELRWAYIVHPHIHVGEPLEINFELKQTVACQGQVERFWIHDPENARSGLLCLQ
jgi:hypothetical protein